MSTQHRLLSDTEIDTVAGGPFTLPIGLQLLLMMKSCDGCSQSPSENVGDKVEDQATVESDTGGDPAPTGDNGDTGGGGDNGNDNGGGNTNGDNNGR